MPIDVLCEVVIRKPRVEVAKVMFDPTREAEWTTGVVASKPLTDGMLRKGSRVERRTRFLGREFGYVYEVVGDEPERSVDISVTNPFPMQVRYQLDEVPEGTRASIRAQGEATGFFKLAAPLMAPMVRKNIQQDLEWLKELVEEA